MKKLLLSLYTLVIVSITVVLVIMFTEPEKIEIIKTETLTEVVEVPVYIEIPTEKVIEVKVPSNPDETLMDTILAKNPHYTVRGYELYDASSTLVEYATCESSAPVIYSDSDITLFPVNYICSPIVHQNVYLKIDNILYPLDYAIVNKMVSTDDVLESGYAFSN